MSIVPPTSPFPNPGPQPDQPIFPIEPNTFYKRPYVYSYNGRLYACLRLFKRYDDLTDIVEALKPCNDGQDWLNIGEYKEGMTYKDTAPAYARFRQQIDDAKM